MAGTYPLQPANSGTGPSSPRQGILSNAIRFWELRRIPYNLVLAAVFAAWVVFTWPHFRPAFTLQSLLFLLILASLANVCYCAAYAVDLPMQYSLFQAEWRQRRWSLWLIGMLFAILIANYWVADEIYPFVR